MPDPVDVNNQPRNEEMVDSQTEVLCLGEAFYAYNRYESTSVEIKESGERQANEITNTMVGIFMDESSFLGIETSGHNIILKSSIPSSPIEQQTTIKLMSQFCLKLMACSSEEGIMMGVNE